jgi:hypothetical protein
MPSTDPSEEIVVAKDQPQRSAGQGDVKEFVVVWVA